MKKLIFILCLISCGEDALEPVPEPVMVATPSTICAEGAYPMSTCLPSEDTAWMLIQCLAEIEYGDE